jgi:2-methylisocitrate lyase-like PEP mutase family enzyme
MNLNDTFPQLHAQRSPFILGNIWDVSSARAFESSGYKAIGTSSQAVAMANGYEDGEELPFLQLLYLAKKVVEAVRIPFTVDLEGGYARTIHGITGNITRLHDIGVAGINLEDTIPGDTRKLLPPGEFIKILSAVADHIHKNNLKVFVNVRTDGFLLGLPNAPEESIRRIKLYQDSGADGIFVPCIVAPADIRAVVNSTYLPVNVMCMPSLPSFEELASLGVKRISMGGFLFHKMRTETERLANAILRDGNFSPILS